MTFFEPDRFFSRISAIDIQADLIGAGYMHVLLDIDNTVRSRADGCVPKDISAWMARARDAGIEFCFLSNNWHKNVFDLADKLSLPVVAKACKPQPFGFGIALGKLGKGATRKNTIVIGDQLLTDVVGAHLAGMKAYLVLPLAEVDLKHTQILRVFERALMGTKQPEPACVNQSSVYANQPSACVNQSSACINQSKTCINQPGTYVNQPSARVNSALM